MKLLSPAFGFLILASIPSARGDGAADNLPENVRRIPPPGVAIPEDARRELTSAAARLKENIDASAAAWEHFPVRYRFLPDVQVFWKAVDWALRYDEFYDPKQVEWARAMVREGATRLEALGSDQMPWLAQTGLVVRGYRSRIDDSVQPFGLVVPPSFHPNYPHRWRLDCWFHGRGEKLTELDFIHARQTSPGEFTPQDTIVLHPYGRYCNGQRFAGETDFFEALETVKRDYRIDDDRIIVRGFSLGGAACWHLAAHHAWQWCAAAPGAGFSETEEFLNFFQGETLQPQPWERKLWNLYDATAVAANFRTLPTVAYSGELDRQKQAADAMARAMDKESLTLSQIIGPKTGHSYERTSKAALNERVDHLARSGKRPPQQGAWQTATLRYDRFDYGTIDSLEEHWKLGRIDFYPFQTSDEKEELLWVGTSNVNALTLEFDVRTGSILMGKTTVVLGYPSPGEGWFGQKLKLSPRSDGSLRGSFVVVDEGAGKHWALRKTSGQADLRKKHGLQGPIDDAFMESFLFVRPTGTAANEKVGAWSTAELDRAIVHWRRHFRGDARVKDDFQVTDHDINTSNIVVWGDPASNKLLGKFAGKLPISWTPGEIRAGDQSFPSTNHTLIAIYPNPLNPEKYVVLNSSFTFREYDYLNNARQTPKLPDWAIIDLDTPPNSRTPGKIVAADFFDETWELKKTQ
jgi:pimeloyl-ACP methyl ester carboxylesterase